MGKIGPGVNQGIPPPGRQEVGMVPPARSGVPKGSQTLHCCLTLQSTDPKLGLFSGLGDRVRREAVSVWTRSCFHSAATSNNCTKKEESGKSEPWQEVLLWKRSFTSHCEGAQMGSISLQREDPGMVQARSITPPALPPSPAFLPRPCPCRTTRPTSCSATIYERPRPLLPSPPIQEGPTFQAPPTPEDPTQVPAITQCPAHTERAHLPRAIPGKATPRGLTCAVSPSPSPAPPAPAAVRSPGSGAWSRTRSPASPACAWCRTAACAARPSAPAARCNDTRRRAGPRR